MRFLIFIAIFLFSYPSFGQIDFRNVKWGMSIEQVKANETAPLSNSEKSFSGTKNGNYYYSGNDLTYEGVTVGGKKADLYYHFENGKLLKIRVVFRHDLFTNYNENLTNVFNGFKQLFEALGHKGFKLSTPLRSGEHVYTGADYNNPINTKILEMKNWNITSEVLRLNETMINEKHYKASFFRIENLRTRGSMMFMSKYSELQEQSPVILELRPSSQIERQLESSDF